MAKSRQQRRARRAEQAAAGGGEARAEGRRADRREPRAEAPPAREAARPERAPRGSFVRESYGELRKVEWPGRQQVMTGTIVVVIACALVGAYLWVADFAFRNLVERVLI